MERATGTTTVAVNGFYVFKFEMKNAFINVFICSPIFKHKNVVSSVHKYVTESDSK